LLPDILRPDLTVVLVGTAKSDASVRAGHYYASPRNQFWQLLEATGLAGPSRIAPENDRSVLEHGVGLTDLVPGRAASADDLLDDRDFDLPGFLGKMEAIGPRAIGFNGATGCGKLARYLNQPVPRPGPLGWEIAGARTWLLPSSSSRNARGGLAVKREQWVAFGEWVGSLSPDPG
jgi:double-stranded uracil-DNA glycosylase